MVAFARWIRASDRQSPLNTENLSIVLYIPPPKRPTHAAHPHLPPPPPSSLPIYLPPTAPTPTPTKTSHQPLHIINHKRRYNTNSISQRSPPPQKPSHLHRTTLTQIKQHTPHKNLLHRRVRFLFAGGELRFAGGRLGCCVCALAGGCIVVLG